MATDNPPIKTIVTLPHMYSFIFLNVSRLFTKTKLKYKVLFDLCGPSTLFLCLCETFLMDSINDSEIQIPGFVIVRCDRLLSDGDCSYVRNTKSFSVCLKYYNSICDLLIVKLHQPSLIIILMYPPPTCPITEFNDIILKTWSCSTTSCSMAGPLIDLAGLLFLAQQVKEPTRKLNILDQIFCPDDLVNYITTTDIVLSDHRIINVSISIPVPQTIPVAQSLHPSSNVFEKIDFNRADCPQLAMSLII